MNTSKEKEAAAEKVYLDFWDSYLKGDIPVFSSTLDEDFEMIGTSETEVCHTKAEGIAFFKNQIKEIVGKAEMRNRNILIKAIGEMFLFIENCDIYVLAESDWTFYSKIRISTLLHETPLGWKILHQHGSIPDMKVSEGETLALQKISQENLELKQAVKRRTSELEYKNQELEIEAALERVRAVAMSMKKPDDMLDVCQVIADQLKAFGVAHIRNVQTAIIDEEKGHYLCYQYFPAYDKTVVELTEYFKSPVEHEMVRQMLASKDGHFIGSIQGKALREFADHRKEENHFPDPLLDQSKELSYCFLSIGEGGLGLSLYDALTQEVLHLFKRFHQVFTLAYRRFLDIQQAEAQAREAKIEAALEKVRSRSMGMQNSGELQEVIKVVFEQFRVLKIPIEHTGFIMDNQEREDMNIWLADENQVHAQITFPYFDSPHWNSFLEAKAKGKDFFSNLLDFETKNRFYKKLFNYIPDLPQKTQEFYFAQAGLSISTVLMDNVGLYFENYTTTPFTEEENQILKRFGKVFQQTYTRFLDLQKAEAQAKEARIEAALERVRSRSLAMHHSSELSSVVDTLLQEFTGLDFSLTFCIINLIDGDDLSNTVWAANPETGKDAESYYMKFEDYDFHRAMWDAWKAQDKRFVYVLEGEEKKIYDEYLYSDTEFRRFPKHVQEANKSLERYVAGFTFFKYSGLQTVSVNPISEEELAILERFGKVFEQAYIRFLDLQKAEAQAREAQIEAAMEKVRSRSLAMHKSDELNEVVKVLFEKMTELQIPSTAIGIQTFTENSKDMQCFVCGDVGTGPVISHYLLPYFEHPILQDYKEVREKNLDVYVGYYSKKLKDSFYDVVLNLPELKNIPEEVRIMIRESEDYKITMVAAKKSVLAVNDFYGNSLSESQINILKRFGKVFDQTYTRFLDLQKAEAQAREAQIEAALERVRSRTMGMQKAAELGDVAQLLFGELNGLVDDLWTCGFVLCEKDRQEDEWWLSLDNGLIQPFSLPNVGDFAHENLYEGWQKQESYRTVTLENQDLQKHYDWLMELPIAKKIFEDMEAAGIPRPKWQRLHAAYFKTGYLVIITEVPCAEEEIFKRFAQVFDQTYTRFLDLQKAEAQAREAQINLAVERVRARALAMNKSEEILDVVFKLKEELMGLDISGVAAATILLKESDGRVRSWDLTSMEQAGDKMNITSDILFDLEKTHPDFYQREIWAKGNTYLVVTQDSTSLQISTNWLRDHGKFMEAEEAEKFIASARIEKVYHPSVPLAKGRMVIDLLESPQGEVKSILTKMAAAFDLAYKRFEDLQKAESQAKEAQIELSLERIRSKVTSMQESTDLLDIMVSIRSEFVSLGHEAHYFWYMRWLPDKYEKAMTSGDGAQVGMIMTLPRHIHGDIPLVANWERGHEPTLIFPMEVDSAMDYVHKMVTLGDFEKVDPHAPTMDDIRHIGGLTFVMARTSRGEIGYSLPGYVPNPSEDAVITLARFAGVFDLAYKRFEDLKKAEKDLVAIKAAKAKAESALKELKAAQEQLVQQEKLASLGQLTAGIAHEIKNPLNFVNNFSELSKELIEEVFDELEKLDPSDIKQDIFDLLTDVQSNLAKVHEHGSRADGIVKSMLQHSRGSSGKTSSIRINEFVKEFGNLAYHGMRAGKNPIHVNLDFELDEDAGEATLVTEDFSRVILNIAYNAFDAMREKLNSSQNEDYLPCLKIKTKRLKKKVQISIQDNGPGIPEEIKDKILQPFFTTKKGTEGTGLGLSITHDIVKAHGGQLDIQSQPGSTIFNIQLNF